MKGESDLDALVGLVESSRRLFVLTGAGCSIRCGGILKPAVAFFGEQVPRRRVERAFAALEEADAVLGAGSSLMVYSGYRFAPCRRRSRAAPGADQPRPYPRRRRGHPQARRPLRRAAAEVGGGAGTRSGVNR